MKFREKYFYLVTFFTVSVLVFLLSAYSIALPANYVTKKSFKNWNIYAETKNNTLDFMPKNEPLPKEVVYRGVKEAQWKIIDRLGDPLNCRKKVFDLQELDYSEFHQVLPKDCDKNPDCINIALRKHQRIMLRGGVYRIKTTVKLEKKVLVGHPDEIVVLNAHNKFTGIRMNKSVIANLRIENAINEGIKLDTNNLIYRVVVGNTGVYSSRSTRGIGVEQSGIFGGETINNCVVSVEAYNGFNHRFCPACENVIGGSADGFDVMHGATNATFIDVHGHHNSDHGLDFYNGGALTEKSNPPVIRVFYSSAIKNGNNPHFKGGNGGGWKLDAERQQIKEISKHQRRLIYGSASCFNRDHGFSKPGKTGLTFIANYSPKELVTKLNYEGKPLSYWGNGKTDDPHVLKCGYFRNVKGRKSYEIPMFFSTYFKYMNPQKRKMIQTQLKDYGYSSKIDGIWGRGTEGAVRRFIVDKVLKKNQSDLNLDLGSGKMVSKKYAKDNSVSKNNLTSIDQTFGNLWSVRNRGHGTRYIYQFGDQNLPENLDPSIVFEKILNNR